MAADIPAGPPPMMTTVEAFTICLYDPSIRKLLQEDKNQLQGSWLYFCEAAHYRSHKDLQVNKVEILV